MFRLAALVVPVFFAGVAAGKVMKHGRIPLGAGLELRRRPRYVPVRVVRRSPWAAAWAELTRGLRTR
ncbi:MAG: hypothetical protein Kow0092_27130 [Deferrisomatales bacterium]